MAKRIIRTCTDRILEEQKVMKVAGMAVGLNPANAPLLMTRERPSPLEMALETRKLWQPSQTLRVRFLDGPADVQAKVEQVAHMWEEYANIKFLFGTDPGSEIRISFIADPGSWSYVGTDILGIPKDEPTMNYGWLKPNTPMTEYHRVVLHEFGHSLGCIHEHQNPVTNIPWNKPLVYQMYAGAPNFWSKDKVDSNLFQKYSADQTQYSHFDTQSIMLYPIPKALTLGGFEVGWNQELSQTDMTFIGTLYPFQAKQITQITVGASPVKASIGMHDEEDLYRFGVSAAGRYTIQTGGITNVMMGLFGPDNQTTPIANDDDSGRGFNAKIVAVLTPGTYYVRVRHHRPSGTGKYRIEVRSNS